MTDKPRNLPDLRAGLYRHYKGPLYQAFGYAHDANYDGRIVVMYMGVELEGSHKGPRMAVRTLDTLVPEYENHDSWEDLVCIRHGCKMGECPREAHSDRDISERFSYRGNQYLGGNQHDRW